jgi:hypothetical protein
METESFGRDGAEMKLLSLPQITALFPKNAKPAEKKIRGLVKSSRYCIKIGRKLYIRAEDVDSFLASLCSSSTETPRVRSGMYAAPSPDGGYAKVRKRLIEDGRKRVAREMANFLTHSDFGSNRPLRGVKR